jgi:hypothetical protein
VEVVVGRLPPRVRLRRFEGTELEVEKQKTKFKCLRKSQNQKVKKREAQHFSF